MRHAVAAVACVLLAAAATAGAQTAPRLRILELQPRLVVLLGQLAGFDPRHSTLQVLAVGRVAPALRSTSSRNASTAGPGS